ncbi:MAG TPA: endonuclease [Flavobacteriales bacterium]|nr:endonuclease [Crocinitomicaceae bacterium]HAE32089.1 endonuclease [Flavobacteriales bacterium]
MKYCLSIFIVLIVCFSPYAQKFELNKDKNYKLTTIGFYNLENLFDTIVDPNPDLILQDDFTPNGNKNWNTAKYYEKLDNLATVISQIGTEATPDGLAVLGVCEIENRSVLEDLVKVESISSRNYQIVHYDSPDHRGIDVGFLYNPNYFKVTSSKNYKVTIPGDPNWTTRDELLVSGELDGERMHFIICHWPSRRGGEKKSRPKRVIAAKMAKHITDSIQLAEPNAKVIIMGDLNDDPLSPSIKEGLMAKRKWEEVENGELFNPMENLHRKGIGTHFWRDNPNVFDMIIVSSGMVPKNGDFTSYKFYKAKVFSKNFLKQQTGNWKGYPFRTYAGGSYLGGYSDHYPVYMLSVKEVN